MNVDTWHSGEEDPGRVKRLAVGYLSGIALIAASVSALATVKGETVPVEEEEVVDVKLAPTLEKAPEPPPPPPPPPVKAPQTPVPIATGPSPRKAIVAPTEVPTELPPESKTPVPPSTGTDEYADGKGGVVGGTPGGTGTGAVAAAAPPPPPPPPPKPQGPIALTEDMTPPVALSNPQPAYPADARSQGVQAKIVVRFVITETGEVTNVTIVRGHPMFDAAVLSTVRTWRFKPALADGRPVSVTKTVPINFSIKM